MRCRVTDCSLIWVTRGIMGFPYARGGRADRNWVRTIVVKIRQKSNVRIGALMNWAEVWEEQQGITSVKCEKAHSGLHSVTVSLRPMC